jgi:hypothetical protein
VGCGLSWKAKQLKVVSRPDGVGRGYGFKDEDDDEAPRPAQVTRGGSASGTDVWVSNRLYTPDTNGFRPYAGVRVEKNSRGAVTETGSALTAMSYNGVNTTKTIGEAGVRYEAEVNDTVNVLAEAGRTTNDITSIKVGASFTPEKNVLGTITVGQQRQNGVVNSVAQAMLKWMF